MAGTGRVAVFSWGYCIHVGSVSHLQLDSSAGTNTVLAASEEGTGSVGAQSAKLHQNVTLRESWFALQSTGVCGTGFKNTDLRTTVRAN